VSEFLRQTWALERARWSLLWHHPGAALLLMLAAVVLYVVIVGAGMAFEMWRRRP
jgi:hypothetical protein